MNKILEYQKIDSERIKLERGMNDIEEKAIMNKMIAFVKDAQNKSLQLENSSKALLEEYTQLKKAYENNTENVNALIKTQVGNMTKDELGECLKKVNALSSELFMIERNINILITKINEKLKEFEVAKNNAGKARAKHREAKEKYESKRNDMQPKLVELDNKLKALEKEISPEVLAKYKTLRNDGIFPILVPVVNKCCGGCRMEIPSSTLDKLKTNKVTQCEHCRRVIYNKD